MPNKDVFEEAYPLSVTGGVKNGIHVSDHPCKLSPNLPAPGALVTVADIEPFGRRFPPSLWEREQVQPLMRGDTMMKMGVEIPPGVPIMFLKVQKVVVYEQWGSLTQLTTIPRTIEGYEMAAMAFVYEFLYDEKKLYYVDHFDGSPESTVFDFLNERTYPTQFPSVFISTPPSSQGHIIV